jgi:hypothetical protein
MRVTKDVHQLFGLSIARLLSVTCCSLSSDLASANFLPLWQRSAHYCSVPARSVKTSFWFRRRRTGFLENISEDLRSSRLVALHARDAITDTRAGIDNNQTAYGAPSR